MLGVSSEECVVMVTGGSGFLGQHVIKLLNTHADHVTSIRVVDLVQYENNLDYKPTKPISTYVGSITDEVLMKEAMKDCHSVIHLAGIADYSMFPNKEKLEKVNVTGTAVTLNIAQETSTVRRFIGCGTSAVLVNSTQSILNGSEETPLPRSWLYKHFTSSKYESERLTLAANAEQMSTVVLRPPSLYGELDPSYVPINLRLAKKCGGVLYQVNCGDSIHQQAYVGNVAWAFICAEKKLYDTQNAFDQSSDKRGELRDQRDHVNDANGDSNITVESRTLKSISGQAYFIADDTPNQNVFQFMGFFLKECGYSKSNLKIPYYFVFLQLYFIYILLSFFSLFGFKFNMEYSIPTLKYLNSSITVSYEKAKRLIGYVPLFTPEKSMERSALFYKKLK